MLRRSQLLFKRLAFGHHSKSAFKTVYPPTLHNDFSNKAFLLLLHKTSFITIPLHSFSSSSKKLTQTDYHKDLELLQVESEEELSGLKRLMDLYEKGQDLSTFSSADISLISTILFNLANFFRQQGDLDRAFRYLIEDESLQKRAGMKDTLELAENHFLRSSIYLDQHRETDAEYYLNEVDRICKLLGDNAGAKNLMVRNWANLAYFYLQSDLDKALSLCDSVLERTDDVFEQVLPDLLSSVYRVMGAVYGSKQDVEKALKSFETGLKLVTDAFGENSHHSFALLKQIAEFLDEQEQFQSALPYAEKAVKVALNLFPKDGEEVASSFRLLGNIEMAHKNFSKALALYKKAAKFYENSPSSSDYLHEIYFQVVRIYCLQGDFKPASSYLAKADQALMLKSGEDEQGRAEIYAGWAQEMVQYGNMTKESEAYFLKAVDLLKKSSPLNKTMLKNMYGTLGKMAFDQQEWDKTQEYFEECETFTEQNDYIALRAANMYQGSAFMYLDKFDEAEKCFLKVIQGRKPEDRDELDAVRTASQNLGTICKGKGRLEEALQFYKKALYLWEKGENKHEMGVQDLAEQITQLENMLQVKSEKSKVTAGKISDILKTFKNPEKK